jgi:hypothetical protein
MTRTRDQLDRIEASLARLEEALNGHAAVLRDQLVTTRIDAAAARRSADSAHAGVRALADMLPLDPSPNRAPQPPSAVPTAAGGEPGGEPGAARRTPTGPTEKM